MTGQYKPGDFVNITIERALVAESRFDDGIRIEYDGDAAELPLGPSVTIERADPQWWPPRPDVIAEPDPEGSCECVRSDAFHPALNVAHAILGKEATS